MLGTEGGIDSTQYYGDIAEDFLCYFNDLNTPGYQ